VGREIISAAEVLAAGLQRTNMATCEAIKRKDISKQVCRQERKTSRIFQANFEGSRKIGHITPCATLEKTPTQD